MCLTYGSCSGHPLPSAETSRDSQISENEKDREYQEVEIERNMIFYFFVPVFREV